ncbi:MAG: hypothetical protein COV48_05405, partial [Elusimicrobia bacterium CG11_big_fil_rev_8_21_14_0_20_64_6]
WPAAPAPSAPATARWSERPAPDDPLDWHDAPADAAIATRFRAASATGATPARTPISARLANASRHERELRAAPSAAETDPVSKRRSRPRPVETQRRRAGLDAPGLIKKPPTFASLLQHRIPLALGPAAPNAGPNEQTVVVQRQENRAEKSVNSRRGGFSFPLFKAPRHRAASRSRGRHAASRRRTRPLRLSRMLGRGALRPPPASIVPPDLSGLDRLKPKLLPDGSPTPTRAFTPDRLEALEPRLAGAVTERRKKPHWDVGTLWHSGAARGLSADGRWLWLWKEKARWWAAGEKETAALLRHKGVWWSKQRGVWFALHDGTLWSWRRFSQWDAEGLIRLTDGVQIVYSADYTKVAVITPGAGAVLYDALTGAELGEWLESELPRRLPRAPKSLRLPRGI